MRLLGEDHKIGYTALILGVISLLNAWMNILRKQIDGMEILFLAIGLVASLWGISLILRRGENDSSTAFKDISAHGNDDSQELKKSKGI